MARQQDWSECQWAVTGLTQACTLGCVLFFFPLSDRSIRPSPFTPPLIPKTHSPNLTQRLRVFHCCESWQKTSDGYIVLCLADERDRVQKKTFTKWVNKHLITVRVSFLLPLCLDTYTEASTCTTVQLNQDQENESQLFPNDSFIHVCGFNCVSRFSLRQSTRCSALSHQGR